MPIYLLLERQHIRESHREGQWIAEDKLCACFEADGNDDAERKKRRYMKDVIGNVILFRLEAIKVSESE